MECPTQLNGDGQYISEGWHSLLLNRAKWIDNKWRFLSVPSVDTDQSGSTVFVTTGDPNAQSGIILASHCLRNTMFSKQTTVEASMRTDTSLNLSRKQSFVSFCIVMRITSPSVCIVYFFCCYISLRLMCKTQLPWSINPCSKPTKVSH